MRVLAYILTLLSAFWIVPTGAQSVSTPLVLAVHPYLPATEIVMRFTPLANYLAHELGQPVTVRVGRNYAEHIDAIGRNNIDIAYMGPASYVKMAMQYGKKPLLARQEVDGQAYLRGAIIVRQDSPLRSLGAMKGKRFAFGDPDSTMSHVVPQRMLEQAGVPEKALANLQFLGSHKNVALAVLAGDFDAGAVKQEVFEEMAPKGLRALAFSPLVADHVFVASSKLSAAQVAKLRAALLRLKAATDQKSILQAIHPKMTALVPALDSDYDSLRALMSGTER